MRDGNKGLANTIKLPIYNLKKFLRRKKEYLNRNILALKLRKRFKENSEQFKEIKKANKEHFDVMKKPSLKTKNITNKRKNAKEAKKSVTVKKCKRAINKVGGLRNLKKVELARNEGCIYFGKLFKPKDKNYNGKKFLFKSITSLKKRRAAKEKREKEKKTKKKNNVKNGAEQGKTPPLPDVIYMGTQIVIDESDSSNDTQVIREKSAIQCIDLLDEESPTNLVENDKRENYVERNYTERNYIDTNDAVNKPCNTKGMKNIHDNGITNKNKDTRNIIKNYLCKDRIGSNGIISNDMFISVISRCIDIKRYITLYTFNFRNILNNLFNEYMFLKKYMNNNYNAFHKVKFFLCCKHYINKLRDILSIFIEVIEENDEHLLLDLYTEIKKNLRLLYYVGRVLSNYLTCIAYTKMAHIIIICFARVHTILKCMLVSEPLKTVVPDLLRMISQVKLENEVKGENKEEKKGAKKEKKRKEKRNYFV
ncbi:conserved Plasmodium protein, unknown function [Plasmodium ovale]|uniref:Uncharacterized protein n=2 Tax=Plasmodium ovale TaxID=36330 RepID=A0A1A8VLS3_PLAOA|nr:conserved Plasmodium protein, unknown function [Plasmodium ovale curtisi]SBS80864.1 conserved Plasmodium protein, unknown function [Plasmodium ovale curtisi]SCA48365.1 conserved Plasmodium protein, unknown function [Plasmodium ovale]